MLGYSCRCAHCVLLTLTFSQVKTSGEKGWTNISNYFKQLTTADDEEEEEGEGEKEWEEEEGESGSRDRNDSWKEEGWGDDWGDMQGYGGHKKQPVDVTEGEQNRDWLTGEDSSWGSKEQDSRSGEKPTSSAAVIAVGKKAGQSSTEDEDLIDWSEADGWGSWGTAAPSTTKSKSGKTGKAD